MFNIKMQIIQESAGPLEYRIVIGAYWNIFKYWHHSDPWTGAMLNTPIRTPMLTQNDENSDPQFVADLPAATVLLYKRNALRVM